MRQQSGKNFAPNAMLSFCGTGFALKFRWRPKKERFSTQSSTNIGRNFGFFGLTGYIVYMCRKRFLVGEALSSMGGRLNLDGKRLTLDGETRPQRFMY